MRPDQGRVARARRRKTSPRPTPTRPARRELAPRWPRALNERDRPREAVPASRATVTRGRPPVTRDRPARAVPARLRRPRTRGPLPPTRPVAMRPPFAPPTASNLRSARRHGTPSDAVARRAPPPSAPAARRTSSRPLAPNLAPRAEPRRRRPLLSDRAAGATGACGVRASARSSGGPSVRTGAAARAGAGAIDPGRARGRGRARDRRAAPGRRKGARQPQVKP
jgi:hypothetical protein